MGKKQFIKKGEGKKFYLLHRSQTDSAYANEENPSNFVLVEQLDSAIRNASQIESSKHEIKNIKDKLFRTGDHITPDGFKNDGYDYSKHFKEMGSGKFIGSDGQFHEAPLSSKSVNLPPELLPSNEELERNLEAIVISEKYMDDDIRRALNEDADDEGDFEELDDNFVVQAMTEPEVPDFDFDAHIAKLIAASQRDIQYVPGRPWDRNEANDESDEYDVEGDYIEEEEDIDDNQSVTLPKMSSAQQAIIDEHFEKIIEEYADSELGDLADADEDDIGGYIDLEDGNEALEDALDEFLREQVEDRKYEKPVTKMQQSDDSINHLRNQVEIMKIDDNFEVVDELDPHDIINNEERRKKEIQEQMKLQEEALEVIEEVNEIISKQTQDELWNSVKYLAEDRVVNQWDCETILSTYSTLDNHPSVIRDENSKFRPHKSRFIRASEAADQRRQTTMKQHEAMINNPNRQLVGEIVTADANSIKPIILSSKNHLPIGYGPSSKGTIGEEDDEESTEEGSVAAGAVLVRSKDETKEEKKARKLLSKQQKREKRAIKKEIKNVYQSETSKQARYFAKQQDINNAHVFKTVA